MLQAQHHVRIHTKPRKCRARIETVPSTYYLPFLVRAGHLKPLGKPAQNARKWFATVEIERMSGDLDWLDKAIRIVEKQIQEMNHKQRGKEHKVALAR